ncbi:hypothetical protein RvVAR0630_34190 [Agrobacterium vitis]|nr:hypothetical protein RvVAR0630_34190 [Agrobacterium vitis]
MSTVLSSPRAANFGFFPKANKVIWLSEMPLSNFGQVLSVLERYSLKMGVAQMAGFKKSDKTYFAATDPRGDGVAIAI